MSENKNTAPPFPRTPKMADAYIRENLKKRNDRYRPAYHAAVPLGWANDPNGSIWYNGRMHLFYQHNPYAPSWDLMHWGHMASSDFARWEDLPVALGPDMPYEALGGCFSGTALEKDGRLYLMYTATTEHQQQCLAVSDDGIYFEKHPDNPVIPYTLVPEGFSDVDIRDPKLFEHEGRFYCLLGTKDKNGFGNILLFTSGDLLSWQAVGPLFTPDDPEADNYLAVTCVCECPDWRQLSGTELLLFSPERFPQEGTMYENAHCSVYMTGTLDFETGRFSYRTMGEIDGGFDFYAPQSFSMPDGRSILIGWKEMWGRSFPTFEDGWVGSFTLPRELSVKGGQLIQKPARELQALRANPVSFENVPLPAGSILSLPGIVGNNVELEAEIDMKGAKKAGLSVFAGTGRETDIYYDAEKGFLIFDRAASGTDITGDEENTSVRSARLSLDDNRLHLHLFLDVSCLEIFAEDGKAVLTGNIYADPAADTGIFFYAEGGDAIITRIIKYDLAV